MKRNQTSVIIKETSEKIVFSVIFHNGNLLQNEQY